MFKRCLFVTLAVGFLTSASAVRLVAIPDTPSRPMPRAPQGICYCGCDEMVDYTRCMMMCDLSQYADRWWAASCHKRALTPARGPAPASAPAKPAFHTSRRYRYLQAQNQPSTKPGATHGRAL